MSFTGIWVQCQGSQRFCCQGHLPTRPFLSAWHCSLASGPMKLCQCLSLHPPPLTSWNYFPSTFFCLFVSVARIVSLLLKEPVTVTSLEGLKSFTHDHKGTKWQHWGVFGSLTRRPLTVVEITGAGDRESEDEPSPGSASVALGGSLPPYAELDGQDEICTCLKDTQLQRISSFVRFLDVWLCSPFQRLAVWDLRCCLRQPFSKCGSMSCHISITWVHDRNRNSWPHPRPSESETERRAQQSAFYKPFHWFWCSLKFENH